MKNTIFMGRDAVQPGKNLSAFRGKVLLQAS
jgi:hypothetical protein